MAHSNAIVVSISKHVGMSISLYLYNTSFDKINQALLILTSEMGI